MSEFHFPFRLVAAFSDGSRLYFDGLTEAAARAGMEAAQAVHGGYYLVRWRNRCKL